MIIRKNACQKTDIKSNNLKKIKFRQAFWATSDRRPVMGIVRRLLFCRVGRHRRDHRRVRHDGEAWVGRCVDCDRRLRRDRNGVWREAE
jgi:hypothetical protein